MSIGFSGLHLLLPTIASLDRAPDARLLFLGTQDLTFTYDQAAAFLRAQGVAIRDVPPSERRTTNSFAWVSHADWWRYKAFMHQETLFRMLGFQPSQLFTMDVDPYEHADIIHDLNQPVPDDVGQFDLILNQGTLEHIFDVRQALWNISRMTRIGGQVVHMAPVSFINHGFYNFNACLFADFYQQSGWQTEELFYALIAQGLTGADEVYARLAPELLSVIPQGFDVTVFARHRRAPQTTIPIAVQNLYVTLHEAWRHQSRAQSLAAPPKDAAAPRPHWTGAWRDRWRKARILRRLYHLRAETVVLRRPR